jgi:predicted TIM-barrel enzyme
VSSENKQSIEFLRQDEVIKLIESEKNTITSQLMTEASNTIFKRMLRREAPPVADFDLLFFMQVMQEFCSQQEVLQKILAGRGSELDWFPEE